jgi:hypothetical protein
MPEGRAKLSLARVGSNVNPSNASCFPSEAHQESLMAYSNPVESIATLAWVGSSSFCGPKSTNIVSVSETAQMNNTVRMTASTVELHTMSESVGLNGTLDKNWIDAQS